MASTKKIVPRKSVPARNQAAINKSVVKLERSAKINAAGTSNQADTDEVFQKMFDIAVALAPTVSFTCKLVHSLKDK